MAAPFAVASSDMAVVLPRAMAYHFCSLVPLAIVPLPAEFKMSTDLLMSWHERFEVGPGQTVEYKVRLQPR